MFMEIYCMKYSNRCMELLQYVGMLNNLSDKFPFYQVYTYDKEFQAEFEWYPTKPWNVIDQQLWSTTLHGIHTLPCQGNMQQYVFKQKAAGTTSSSKSQPRGLDNQFRNCFDFNRGGCSHPSCSFLHVCGWCGVLSTYNTQLPTKESTAATTATATWYCSSGNNWKRQHTYHKPHSSTGGYKSCYNSIQTVDKVNYVLQGLQHGFSLKYAGPFLFPTPANLPSARLDPQLIRDCLQKEVDVGKHALVFY